jgi:hypothetical protein
MKQEAWDGEAKLFERIRREYEFGVGSIKRVARKLGGHQRMVRQALANANQPSERRRPVLAPLVSFIDTVLRLSPNVPTRPPLS